MSKIFLNTIAKLREENKTLRIKFAAANATLLTITEAKDGKPTNDADVMFAVALDALEVISQIN